MATGKKQTKPFAGDAVTVTGNQVKLEFWLTDNARGQAVADSLKRCQENQIPCWVGINGLMLRCLPHETKITHKRNTYHVQFIGWDTTPW